MTKPANPNCELPFHSERFPPRNAKRWLDGFLQLCQSSHEALPFHKDLSRICLSESHFLILSTSRANGFETNHDIFVHIKSHPDWPEILLLLFGLRLFWPEVRSMSGSKERALEREESMRGLGWVRYKFHIPQAPNLWNAFGSFSATSQHTELPNGIPQLAQTKQTYLYANKHIASLATSNISSNSPQDRSKEKEGVWKCRISQWKEQ